MCRIITEHLVNLNINGIIMMFEITGGERLSVDMLKEIREAEEKAEQIEAQALQKAKEIVAAAKMEASVIMSDSVEQAENDAGGLIRASENKACQDAEKIKEQILAQCEELKNQSKDKLNDAVDFIVGRIVKP